MEPSANPFAALSLIVAPAILTNACTVLAMSTSNRLARAVDRARDLSRQIEHESDHPAESPSETERRLQELAITETRAMMLLRVLRSFYLALAGFAVATLASLIGAVIATTQTGRVVNAFEALGVAAGGVAVGALVYGATLLVRETRLAVSLIHERADSARRRLESYRSARPT
jgi:hypothetical protein